MGSMILRSADIEWLALHFPELTHAPDQGTIEGQLQFCAAFDHTTGQLALGDFTQTRTMDSFLCDAFMVRIELRAVETNGWPRVYEVGGRSTAIAQHNKREMIDLHFFEDGRCCVGLNYAPPRNLTLQRFMQELVVPFFYRLSYTDRYGFEAASAHLWGEYSHGEEGKREYEQEILAFAAKDPSRNQLCPCGSGIKYKKCHYDEVEAVKRAFLRA